MMGMAETYSKYLIKTGTCSWIALRVEIISASISFLDFWLNIKENEVTKRFTGIISYIKTGHYRC